MLTEDGKVTRTGWITVSQAATLLGKSERHTRRYVDDGNLTAKKWDGNEGGGTEGESYLISVQSLPLAAQIKYLPPAR